MPKARFIYQAMRRNTKRSAFSLLGSPKLRRYDRKLQKKWGNMLMRHEIQQDRFN